MYLNKQVDFIAYHSPSASIVYGFDWSQWLSSGETISSSTWTVDITDVVLTNQTISTNVSNVTATGGLLGKSYKLTNSITTNKRSDSRTITLECVQR